MPTYPSSTLYPSATTYPGDILDPEDVIVAHVRDRPPLRESTEIVTPSGKRYRWASDEPRAENVPRDERWSDIMPGGFETLDQTLPRKPSIDYSDLERLSRITRYDASGNVIWQGRLERAPRVSGDQMAISPSAVGYQAHLEDDKSASVIFIDRGIADWSDPSNQRRVSLIANSFTPGGGNVANDVDAIPTLDLGWDEAGRGSATSKPIAEAWYDAGAGNFIWEGTWVMDKGSTCGPCERQLVLASCRIDG